MGTRSITSVIENGTILCTMYRQFDGYPSVHGADLHKFLAALTLVNGISSADNRRIANGAGCLAAQMVHHFKQTSTDARTSMAGNVYITAPRLKLDSEDYGYTVSVDDKLRTRIKCYVVGHGNVDDSIFCGTVAEFGEFCAKDVA